MKVRMDAEKLEYIADWMETEAITIDERSEGNKDIERNVKFAGDKLVAAYRQLKSDGDDEAVVDLYLDAWMEVLAVLEWRENVAGELRHEEDEYREEYKMASALWHQIVCLLPSPLIGKVNAGATVIGIKPTRLPHLEVVLARKDDGFVIWTYNKTTGVYSSGDYFDSPHASVVEKYNAALARFDERKS